MFLFYRGYDILLTDGDAASPTAESREQGRSLTIAAPARVKDFGGTALGNLGPETR